MTVTVPTFKGVDKLHISTIKKSLPDKRCVTDIYGFAALIFMFLMCFGLATIADPIYKIPNSKVINLKMAAVVNESSTDCMALNLSLKVIYDEVLSTFKKLSNEKSLTISFTSKAVMGLLYLMPVDIISFFMKCFVIRITKFSTSRVPDYSRHFTIVFAGKIISTWIFLVVAYSYWTDVSQVKFMTYIAILEPFVLFQFNLCCDDQRPTKFKNVMKRFKNILRYYLDHRYVILFQFLNYLTILILMGYVVSRVHDSFFSIFGLLPEMAILFIIYYVHDYGKMVIILSRASHSWKCEHETISLKTVLSSMITISRYHGGTIVMNVPAFGFLFPTDYSNDTFKLKILMMFTAVHGQNYSKATESVRYFKSKNQLVTNFKNKILSIWEDVLIISTTLLLLLLSFQPFLYNAEDSFPGVPILTLYFALTCSYYYVFVSTMSTVENTIEFCNMIKCEDIKAMHEKELSQGIKNAGKFIATTGANKVNEKKNNEITVNEEKPEVPKDNNIV